MQFFPDPDVPTVTVIFELHVLPTVLVALPMVHPDMEEYIEYQQSFNATLSESEIDIEKSAV